MRKRYLASLNDEKLKIKKMKSTKLFVRVSKNCFQPQQRLHFSKNYQDLMYRIIYIFFLIWRRMSTIYFRRAGWELRNDSNKLLRSGSFKKPRVRKISKFRKAYHTCLRHSSKSVSSKKMPWSRSAHSSQWTDSLNTRFSFIRISRNWCKPYPTNWEFPAEEAHW